VVAVVPVVPVVLVGCDVETGVPTIRGKLEKQDLLIGYIVYIYSEHT
jgi:hypothetical protein